MYKYNTNHLWQLQNIFFKNSIDLSNKSFNDPTFF